ncbi:MAG: DUF4347 domain-containing protein [Magnetococcales bacterium]|nr:DUF4347 domain-containing protein [Magnetococcales bacterium]
MIWFGKTEKPTGKQPRKKALSPTQPPAMGRRFQLAPLALEPRLLFDGAGIISGLNIDQDLPLTPSPSPSENIHILDALSRVTGPTPLPESLALDQQRGSPSALLLIDSRVKDLPTLTSALSSEVAVVLLEPNRGGVEQISQALSEYQNLDAIHIVSHGAKGEIQLGNSSLTHHTLAQYQDDLSGWGGALKETGDILLYGCDVAAGREGVTFINQLSQLTQADVAASDNLTGLMQGGGDWVLEATVGQIEAPLFASQAALQPYSQLLAIQIVTHAGDTGDAGSLREIFNNAADGDTIIFDTAAMGGSTVTLTQTATLNGDLIFDKNLTIDGDLDDDGTPDITIDASGGGRAGRVFLIDTAGITATIDGVILQNGDATATTKTKGGAILVTNGTLALTHSTIKDSSATSGGNIFVETGGSATLSDTTLSGGTATWGGGFYHQGTTASSLSQVTFSANTATSLGGGIYNANTLSLSNSTLSGNFSNGYGGGIYASSGSTATLVEHSTIAFNISNKDDAGSGYGGGIYRSGGTVTLGHSIVSNNTNLSASTSVAYDLHGVIATNGYNLIGTMNGASGITDGVNHDRVGTDPNLQALANNGGPTQTHALLADSAAVNAGDSTITTEPATDQRGTGYDRKVNTIDIGAYEKSLPTLTALSIPNSTMKVGETVTATLTVGDDGGVSLTNLTGTINGLTLSNLTRISATTYSAQMTIAEGGADVAAGDDMTVSLTLDDAAGNTSALFTTAISQGADNIDANSPAITAVSATDATYKAGDTVAITVGFSEAVTVNTSGGTPTLTLSNGATASYVSGSGTTDLIFHYLVSSGDTESADLGTTALNLSGGTIQDGASNTALTTLIDLATVQSVVIDLSTTTPLTDTSTTTKPTDKTSTPVVSQTSSESSEGSETGRTEVDGAESTTTTLETSTADPESTSTSTSTATSTDQESSEAKKGVPAEMAALTKKGLSPSNQKVLLSEMGAQSIIQSYAQSDDPTSKQVGDVLARVSSGENIQRSELIKIMKESNLDRETMMANFLAFDRVQKEQRTQLFSNALAELDRGEGKNILLSLGEPGNASPIPNWFPELIGEKIALFIGINDYQGLIPDLNTPHNDISAMGDLLAKQGYQTINLKDATYQEVIGAFQGIAERIKPGQDLLIYYAGHGYLREDTGIGYWIMGDAEATSAKKWISTQHISEFLAKVKAKNTLLISDSCYSGTLTKEHQISPNAEPPAIQVQSGRTVVTMSSGGEEPVMDGGGNGHSVFAANLIKTLSNAKANSSGFELFEQVRENVTKQFPQEPQYGAILSAGHEIGNDFFFKESPKPTP